MSSCTGLNEQRNVADINMTSRANESPFCTMLNNNQSCQNKIVKQEADSDETNWELSTRNLLLGKCEDSLEDEITDIVKDEVDLKCDSKIKMENMAFLSENNATISSSCIEEVTYPCFEEVVIKQETTGLDEDDGELEMKLPLTQLTGNEAAYCSSSLGQVVIKSEEIDLGETRMEDFGSDGTDSDGSDYKKSLPASKCGKYDWCHSCRNGFARNANSPTPGGCKVCGDKLHGVKTPNNADKLNASDACNRRTHTNIKPYRCEVCAKTFSFLSYATRHYRTHTKEKPYKCDACDRMFSESSQLTIHRRAHTKEKPYKCRFCARSFTESSSLTKHTRTHTNERPFKCHVCDRTFSQSSSVTTHMRVHTKERPYECRVCARSFSDSSSLTKHTRTHTNERPFKCDACDKTFADSSSAARHRRTHTKEKPYKCHVCARSFSESSHVTTHMRTHTNEKPYKCRVCGKAFSQSSQVTRHYRTHTKEKPYNCHVCHRAFRFKASLTTHMRTHANSNTATCM